MYGCEHGFDLACHERELRFVTHRVLCELSTLDIQVDGIAIDAALDCAPVEKLGRERRCVSTNATSWRRLSFGYRGLGRF